MVGFLVAAFFVAPMTGLIPSSCHVPLVFMDESITQSGPMNDYRKAEEKRLPPKTRVYVGDAILVQTGKYSQSFPVESTFTCSAGRFALHDQLTKTTASFPTTAVVRYERSVSIFFVGPHQTIPARLANELKRGQARFQRTL